MYMVREETAEIEFTGIAPNRPKNLTRSKETHNRSKTRTFLQLNLTMTSLKDSTVSFSVRCPYYRGYVLKRVFSKKIRYVRILLGHRKLSVIEVSVLERASTVLKTHSYFSS